MFASCLSMQARQVLERTGGDILEIGPGSGVLAADLYGYLKAQGAAPKRYRLLEVSPDLKERQRARLAERHPEDLDRFEWIDAPAGTHRRPGDRERGARRAALRHRAPHREATSSSAAWSSPKPALPGRTWRCPTAT